jgi:hypothetical protein
MPALGASQNTTVGPVGTYSPFSNTALPVHDHNVEGKYLYCGCSHYPNRELVYNSQDMSEEEQLRRQTTLQAVTSVCDGVMMAVFTKFYILLKVHLDMTSGR